MAKNEQKEKPIYKKIWFWIVIILIISVIVSISTGDTSNNTSVSITTTDISDFTYTIEDGVLTLEKYKGNDDYIIFANSYTIDGVEYPVNNIAHAIFNGTNATTIYFPKSISLVYDDTLAYLNGSNINIYYEGTEEEWNNVFTEYQASSFNEEWNNGNYEESGEALADKLNASIGHSYDESNFTYHYNATIEDIEL